MGNSGNQRSLGNAICIFYGILAISGIISIANSKLGLFNQNYNHILWIVTNLICCFGMGSLALKKCVVPSKLGRAGAAMSILMNVEEADFVYIKEKTKSTAGNLSVQLDKLSKAGYITVEKGFAGRKTRTVCQVTEQGRKAFEDYVDALKSYLNL